jgi:hypothetical protein
MTLRKRTIIARESNIVRVDFRRQPDPPAPKFPGAGALRQEIRQRVNAFAKSPNREATLPVPLYR